MDRAGLDPRTVISVIDNESPVTVADVASVGEDLVKAFPTGLTLETLVPAVKLIGRILKKKMSHEQKKQFIIDALRYTVDNTNSGPGLEELDPIIKAMIPSIVDAFLQKRPACPCFPR